MPLHWTFLTPEETRDYLGTQIAASPMLCPRLIHFLPEQAYKDDPISRDFKVMHYSVARNQRRLWRKTSIRASGMMVPWVRTLLRVLEVERDPGCGDSRADWETTKFDGKYTY